MVMIYLFSILSFVHGINHYLSEYSSISFGYSYKVYLSTYVGSYFTLLQVDKVARVLF